MSARNALLAAALLASAALPACQDLAPRIDLERMIEQDHYRPYAASPYFADGRSMRTPPEGTLPRDAVIDPARDTGVVNGAYVQKIPFPVTRPFVERGKNRFETFCAACHGVLGDGVSRVADNMDLRKPPSLVDAARDFPPGRIYQAIQLGYGLMRPYTEDLTLEERWAVVAYVRALQARRAIALDDLPPAMRERAERELR